MPKRLAQGPIEFRICAQLAEAGDEVDDATVLWPESREVVELGTVKLERVLEGDKLEQKRIVFNSVPKCKGIETTADSLWELRAAVYSVSGEERRAA